MTIVHLGAKRVQGLKIDRVNDSLGSSADGSASGITLVNINNYATFNGSSSYITTSGTQSDTDFQASESFSVAFWFNSSDSGGAAFIDRWGTQNGSGNNGWLILKDSGTACSFRLSSNWGASPQAAIRVVSSSNSAFGDGEWHHLVITYGGSGHTSVKIYVDGAEDTSASANITGTVGSITYGLPLEIGAYSSTHSDKYDGSMKQVLIYDDVITSSEVTTLYNSGTPVTSPSTSNLVARYDLGTDANDSQGSINGTATNITFVSDAYKLGTGAYYFDGSDSTKPNVKISDIDLFSGATKEYTLSFWLKADFDHDSSSDNRCIFDFSGSNQIQFFKHPSANWKLNFDSGSDLTLSGGTEAVPDDGAFHHICVTRNSSSLYTVYVDGVSKGTITQTLNVNSGSALNFYLGSYDSVDQEFWKGWIDDVGIWSRVLTATEIEK